MGHLKYTEEFKNVAVNQVTEKGHSVVSAGKNLGISYVTLYAFIKENQPIFRTRPICQTLQVDPSGYYKWTSCPESEQAKANAPLTELIIEYWDKSGRTYGSPRIHGDLREADEACSDNRVARLMKEASRKAVHAMKKPRVFT